MSGSMNVTFSRSRYVSVFFVEPGAKVNSEYYCQHVLGGGLLPDTVQDASATPGPCRRTAHRHTLQETHLTLFGVPFSRWLEGVVQQQGGYIEHVM